MVVNRIKMKFKFTLSIKFTIVLFVLLSIAVALNGRSYRVSINTIENDIQDSYYEQLRFFLFQLENQVDNLAASLLELEEDSIMKQYINTTAPEDLFDVNMLRFNMYERIKLQSASSNWPMEISVFLKPKKEVISTRPDRIYEDIASIPRVDLSKGVWNYEPRNGNNMNYFTMVRSGPAYTILSRFPDTYIRDMLNKFQQNANRFTLMYHPKYGFIGNLPPQLGEWEGQLDWESLQQPGKQILDVNGHRMLLNHIPVESLGWVILDWVPLESVVLPVKESNRFFVLGILAMLAVGVVITVLIYRQIQHPINELVVKLQAIRSGDFSARLNTNRGDEFHEVFAGFNNMAERIQELIEKVYEEKLRLKEVELKQLQSQINPHFLYNCLFYIKNMAKMGEDELVEAMALSLAEYYRYMTRLENSLTTVREEVKFLRNYLNIHSLRKPMSYEINISEELMETSIPRLLIQPLVENAIIHGIGNSDRKGVIRIEGDFIPGGLQISVEDSGDGLDLKALDELRANMNRPLSPETGCGLWNTHQRLIHLYAPGSGLLFDRSSLGGLRVSIYCMTNHQEELHVKLADR